MLACAGTAGPPAVTGGLSDICILDSSHEAPDVLKLSRRLGSLAPVAFGISEVTYLRRALNKRVYRERAFYYRLLIVAAPVK